MHLEKIELQGFKSFANRTIIDFPQTHKNNLGITAIVGPNGSGKSNIVDAVRWVLGEQSNKSLRGQKAEDIIFAGSPAKPRQGFAEVTLFFNNENKSSPVDYEQIIITRRLYRDGEGEYFLNKNKARLMDILLLLAKCNVGQKSYSIISQGMITQIINATLQERKEFFDEATGIKQYQIKKDHAQNKLKRVKENLTQSQNILEELEPHLRLLKRQVKKLEQRQLIEKELHQLQAKYYSQLWNNLEDENQKIVTVLKELETRLSSGQRENEELTNELQSLTQVSSRNTLYNELQKDYNEILFNKNKLLEELAVLKAKSTLEYTKIGKQNISWLEQQKEEIIAKIRGILTEIKALDTDITTKNILIREKSGLTEELNEKINSLEGKLFLAQKDENNNLIVAKQHLKSLLDQKTNIPGIIGTVADLGKVDRQYSLALETAAGHLVEAVVVQDEDTARECIKFLRENRLGIATFLPLNKIRPKTIRENDKQIGQTFGVIDFAINLVDFDPQFYNIFSFLFGSTLVVKDLFIAKNIGIGLHRMVTLEGDLCETSGALKGGFRRYKSAFSFAQSQKYSLAGKEIENLEAERLQTINQRKQLQNTLNQLKIETEINKNKKQLRQNDLVALEKEQEKFTQEISAQKINPKDAPKILKLVTEQKEQVQIQIDKLEERMQQKKDQIEKFNAQEDAKKEKIISLQQQKQAWQEKQNALNNEYHTYKINLTKIETKKEALVTELVDELGTDYNSKLINESFNLNLEETHLEILRQKQKLNLIGGIDPEITTQYEQVQERYDFLTTQIADLNKALNDTENILKELEKIIKENFSANFKKINTSFNKYFHKLFGGGKAKLDLIKLEKTVKITVENAQTEGTFEQEAPPAEAQTPLVQNSTGIEILACPPHKKITHLGVLSGGEKTLTAIALICAIIDNNHPPFVLLDEVDAALDEANSHKLTNIIKELANFTQFIVITHNRMIMQAADILYGAAMAQDGISKLVSLNISQSDNEK